MNRYKIIAAVLMIVSLASCVDHHDYGPNGVDGRAYFGVDYHYSPPYSYADNNVHVPYNPHFGDFYRTNAGVFEFEYFINPWDYWYGTYHIWLDRGTGGGPYGVPGDDGIDTYLMLYLDPEGWYEDRFEYKSNAHIEVGENELRIELKEAGGTYTIHMRKASTLTRPPQFEPKFKSE